MIRIEGIEEESRCAGRSQGSGNLGTYMSGLAYTGNDNLSFAIADELYRTEEILVQTRDERLNSCCFALQAFYSSINDFF